MQRYGHCLLILYLDGYSGAFVETCRDLDISPVYWATLHQPEQTRSRPIQRSSHSSRKLDKGSHYTRWSAV